tara:strand:- start:180 stop:356 length:177 start_codon:yes stop_codon:yes gene_type:complete
MPLKNTPAAKTNENREVEAKLMRFKRFTGCLLAFLLGKNKGIGGFNLPYQVSISSIQL